MKYSIVIPVYNVEKYIDKCLDSVLNQTYKNFEVIIVNDGTRDNSQKIVDKYVKKDKRFKSFTKENGGLSSARNYGVKHTTGDYLIFIDSDDFINLDYLEKINEVLDNSDIEVLRTGLIVADKNEKVVRREKVLDESRYVSFTDLTSFEFFDSACSYVYNLSFYKKNKFSFIEGVYHEDFGLIPEILIKAKKIYFLNYHSYYYVQRNNSIMTSIDKEILKKRAYDILNHHDRLKNTINDMTIDKKNKESFIYYIENTAIAKIYNLKYSKEEYKKYKNALKRSGIYKFTCTSNYKYIIKKMILKFSTKMYLKYILKVDKWYLV